MTVLENFGPYQISQTPDGQIIELPRGLGELACLAFDTHNRRLTELRLPNDSSSWNEKRWQRFGQAASEWQKNRESRFSHVLEFGQRENLVYYVTTPADGEPVAQYAARRGKLPPLTAVMLVTDLTGSLIKAGLLGVPAPALHPGSVMVDLEESYFLTLKITDLGLSQPSPEPGPLALLRDVQKSLARLLYLLLSARDAADQPAEHLPEEAPVPAELAAFLRQALTETGWLPPNLEETFQLFGRARTELARAFPPGRPRDGLLALGEDRPLSGLRQLLCGHESLPAKLKARFRPEAEQIGLLDPFAQTVTEIQTNRRLNMQFLPGDRMAQSKVYAPLPAGVWKQDPVRHPNLIRAVALWETPDGLFLPEERLTGFSLAWYLHRRDVLSREDAAFVLQQVKAALEQAASCRLILQWLHLADIIFVLSPPPAAGEVEQWMEKPLVDWPGLRIKVRAHRTTKSLMEPWLPLWGSSAPAPAPEEQCNRMFLALAVRLLSLPGQELAANQRLDRDWVKQVNSLIAATENGLPCPSPAVVLKMVETGHPKDQPALKAVNEPPPPRVFSKPLPQAAVKPAAHRPENERPRHETSRIYLPDWNAITPRHLVPPARTETTKIFLGEMDAARELELPPSPPPVPVKPPAPLIPPGVNGKSQARLDASRPVSDIDPATPDFWKPFRQTELSAPPLPDQPRLASHSPGLNFPKEEPATANNQGPGFTAHVERQAGKNRDGGHFSNIPLDFWTQNGEAGHGSGMCSDALSFMTTPDSVPASASSAAAAPPAPGWLLNGSARPALPPDAPVNGSARSTPFSPLPDQVSPNGNHPGSSHITSQSQPASRPGPEPKPRPRPLPARLALEQEVAPRRRLRHSRIFWILLALLGLGLAVAAGFYASSLWRSRAASPEKAGLVRGSPSLLPS